MFEQEPRDDRTGWERADDRAYVEPGAAKERGAVVAWLRSNESLGERLRNAIAASIEAGDHEVGT